MVGGPIGVHECGIGEVKFIPACLSEDGVAPLRVAVDREHVRVVGRHHDQRVFGGGHVEGGLDSLGHGGRLGEGPMRVVQVVGVVDAAACEEESTN